VPVKVIAEGAITGVAYWFTFTLHSDITFSTAPGSYDQVMGGGEWPTGSLFCLVTSLSTQALATGVA